MRNNTLHYFGSKATASNVARVLARLPGNGGQKCFRVEECLASSCSGRRVYRILFLPDQFMYFFPGHVLPNVDAMSGWIRGYCYAMNLR